MQYNTRAHLRWVCEKKRKCDAYRVQPCKTWTWKRFKYRSELMILKASKQCLFPSLNHIFMGWYDHGSNEKGHCHRATILQWFLVSYSGTQHYKNVKNCFVYSGRISQLHKQILQFCALKVWRITHVTRSQSIRKTSIVKLTTLKRRAQQSFRKTNIDDTERIHNGPFSPHLNAASQLITVTRVPIGQLKYQCVTFSTASHDR